MTKPGPEYTTLELTEEEVRIIWRALACYEDDILDGPTSDEYKKKVSDTWEMFRGHLEYYYTEGT